MDSELYRLKNSLSDVTSQIGNIERSMIAFKTLVLSMREYQEDESVSVNKSDSYDFGGVTDDDGSYTDVLLQSINDKNKEQLSYVPDGDIVEEHKRILDEYQDSIKKWYKDWEDSVKKPSDPKIDEALKQYGKSIDVDSLFVVQRDDSGVEINGKFYDGHYVLGITPCGRYTVDPKGYVTKWNWDKDKVRWVKYEKSMRTSRYVCTLVNNEVGEERYKLVKKAYTLNSSKPIKFHKMWRDATGEGRKSRKERGGNPFSNSLRKSEATHFDVYMETE